ncbi:MAG TPA: class II aldolase/adducin family protein [Longilinea sp.]|nr:class II aldolase/adducin family protein [Longilinea sp.]
MNKYQGMMDELLDMTYELYQRGYVTPTGGNLSMRCPDDPGKILITPTSVYKRKLKAEHLLFVDLQGNVLEGKFKASVETPIHLAIYRARSDVNVVIHSHTIYTTIWALTHLPFQYITGETVMMDKLPIIDWTSGTEEAGKVVTNALGKEGHFVVIQNHGLVVAGPTLDWVAGVTDMIEVACQIMVTCQMMGKAPELLSEKSIAMVRNKSIMSLLAGIPLEKGK